MQCSQLQSLALSLGSCGRLRFVVVPLNLKCLASVAHDGWNLEEVAPALNCIQVEQ